MPNCIVCRLYSLSFPAEFLEFKNYGVLAPPPQISCLSMNVLTSFCFKVDSYFSQTRNEPTRTISLKTPRPVVTFPACLPLDANCRLHNVQAVSMVVARFLSRFAIRFRCCVSNCVNSFAASLLCE